MKQTINLPRFGVPAFLAGLIWVIAVTAAALTNSAGGTVDNLTTEADAASVQANTAGASIELVCTDQASLDAVASSVAWFYGGLIDPVAKPTTAAGRLWVMYE